MAVGVLEFEDDQHRSSSVRSDQFVNIKRLVHKKTLCTANHAQRICLFCVPPEPQVTRFWRCVVLLCSHSVTKFVQRKHPQQDMAAGTFDCLTASASRARAGLGEGPECIALEHQT